MPMVHHLLCMKVGLLVGFYCISTLLGYLIPNSVYIYIYIYIKIRKSTKIFIFFEFISFVLTYVLYMCLFPACYFRQKPK